MEREINFKDVIKYLEETENINRLPNEDTIYTDFIWKNDYNDNYLDYWDKDIEITIKDGTKVKLVQKQCMNNKEHIPFYYIEEIDTYICSECLTKHKYPYKIYEEFGEDKKYIYEERLIPADWNENGIRAYLQRGINYWKEFYEKINNRNNDYDYTVTSICSSCCNYINGECQYSEYGYDEEANDCYNYEEDCYIS